jgi:hypothetical protein
VLFSLMVNVQVGGNSGNNSVSWRNIAITLTTLIGLMRANARPAYAGGCIGVESALGRDSKLMKSRCGDLRTLRNG